ncbi:MAG: helix-turn-helix domain-containing protein [Phycisphaerales bacterium]|jgi:hypothetical protein
MTARNTPTASTARTVAAGLPDDLRTAMTPAQVAADLSDRTGRRLSPSTIVRWALHGCRGVRLGYHRIGRCILVTPAEVDEFLAGLAERDVAMAATALEREVARDRPRSERARGRIAARALARAGC